MDLYHARAALEIRTQFEVWPGCNVSVCLSAFDRSRPLLPPQSDSFRRSVPQIQSRPDSLKSTAHSMEPASPTKAAASKKKSAASPMKRPSMAKMGRLLSFSKRGEKRSTAV